MVRGVAPGGHHVPPLPAPLGQGIVVPGHPDREGKPPQVDPAPLPPEVQKPSPSPQPPVPPHPHHRFQAQPPHPKEEPGRTKSRVRSHPYPEGPAHPEGQRGQEAQGQEGEAFLPLAPPSTVGPGDAEVSVDEVKDDEVEAPLAVSQPVRATLGKERGRWGKRPRFSRVTRSRTTRRRGLGPFLRLARSRAFWASSRTRRMRARVGQG